MNIAEEENKKRKSISNNKRETKQDKKPDWFHQDIEADFATAEEIEELEKMLKG